MNPVGGGRAQVCAYCTYHTQPPHSRRARAPGSPSGALALGRMAIRSRTACAPTSEPTLPSPHLVASRAPRSARPHLAPMPPLASPQPSPAPPGPLMVSAQRGPVWPRPPLRASAAPLGLRLLLSLPSPPWHAPRLAWPARSASSGTSATHAGSKRWVPSTLSRGRFASAPEGPTLGRLPTLWPALGSARRPTLGLAARAPPRAAKPLGLRTCRRRHLGRACGIVAAHGRARTATPCPGCWPHRADNRRRRLSPSPGPRPPCATARRAAHMAPFGRWPRPSRCGWPLLGPTPRVMPAFAPHLLAMTCQVTARPCCACPCPRVTAPAGAACGCSALPAPLAAGFAGPATPASTRGPALTRPLPHMRPPRLAGRSWCPPPAEPTAHARAAPLTQAVAPTPLPLAASPYPSPLLAPDPGWRAARQTAPSLEECRCRVRAPTRLIGPLPLGQPPPRAAPPWHQRGRPQHPRLALAIPATPPPSWPSMASLAACASPSPIWPA